MVSLVSDRHHGIQTHLLLEIDPHGFSLAHDVEIELVKTGQLNLVELQPLEVYLVDSLQDRVVFCGEICALQLGLRFR